MPGEDRLRVRDRAMRRVVLFSGGGIVGAAGLTGVLSTLIATSFAATHPRPAAPAAVPVVPVQPAPSQAARPTPAVTVQVLHVPGSVSRGAPTLNPPRQALTAAGRPAAAAIGAPVVVAPPPPAPVCHATPSHPC